MPIETIDLRRPNLPHVETYWTATAGAEVADSAPVASDMDVDVAIVGGGYTGLSAAYHLARDHGIRAHVLEANRIGWGCSGRNGGFCSAGIGKEGLSDWVRRWGREKALAVHRQGHDAVALVRDLLRQESIEADVTAEGGLELAHKPNRLPGLEARVRQARDLLGEELRLLSQTELHRDYLASREGYGALLHNHGFALHALKYARGLARAAQRHGAVLHGASPVTAWGQDGARHLLTTPGGTVRARQVILATNGYTNDSLHPHTAGRLLPVLSNIIATRPLSEAERAAAGWRTHLKIYDSRRLLFYYRLLPDNRVLFGARGGIGDTPAENRRLKAWLQRRLGEMFPPLARVETEYFWHGWVCLSYDRNPHVGSTDDGSVHYALAYIGQGVALATLCGKMLAGRVVDPRLDVGPLLSTPLPRFPLPALRRLYQRAAYAYYGIQDEWL